MSILLLFLDGVGLGEADPAVNPWVGASTPALRRLLGGPLAGRGTFERNGTTLRSADATLGVPGLPQSATGQTALFTGINAAAVIGRHVTAYPTAPLRSILKDHSLFARVCAAGRHVALANAYTPEYHAAVASRRLHHGAITFAAMSAGVTLRSIEHLRRGRAVFHDLTNARLREWGHDVPLRTAEEAGEALASIAGDHDLTVFEFFLTDLAAHGRVSVDPQHVVEMVDTLLWGVLDRRADRTTIVVTSDHGNLEDLRTRGHTRNPVPVVVIGPARPAFRGVAAITDVAPAIMRALDLDHAP